MSVVLTERVGRASIITINRPEARNSLTREVVKSLAAAFDTAGKDPEVRVVVLTGAGGHFCAGADLRKTFEDDPALLDNLEGYMDDYHAVIKAIVRCPKPCIASVDGAAVGFGADLALACDLRVIGEAAYVQEKFVKIGLMPDGGGTFWLPRLVGTARAMQMVLFAEKLEAKRLMELGLALKVVPGTQLREATLAVASELAAGPPLAYREIKAAMVGSWGDLEGALRREREGQLRLLRSSDALEGIAAWMQKREPKFEGK